MTFKRTLIVLAQFMILMCAVIAVAAADGAWLKKVPPNDHQKINPYRDDPEAIAAGRILFTDHCAKCHGENAEGTKKRPSLRSPRVQTEASEGDLHWLLINGNLGRGMPSWSKLPDPQLWQLISYIKTLHAM
jgi:mono/diheme cytochrome c family protein